MPCKTIQYNGLCHSHAQRIENSLPPIHPASQWSYSRSLPGSSANHRNTVLVLIYKVPFCETKPESNPSCFFFPLSPFAYQYIKSYCHMIDAFYLSKKGIGVSHEETHISSFLPTGSSEFCASVVIHRFSISFLEYLPYYLIVSYSISNLGRDCHGERGREINKGICSSQHQETFILLISTSFAVFHTFCLFWFICLTGVYILCVSVFAQLGFNLMWLDLLTED